MAQSRRSHTPLRGRYPAQAADESFRRVVHREAVGLLSDQIKRERESRASEQASDTLVVVTASTTLLLLGVGIYGMSRRNKKRRGSR